MNTWLNELAAEEYNTGILKLVNSVVLISAIMVLTTEEKVFVVEHYFRSHGVGVRMGRASDTLKSSTRSDLSMRHQITQQYTMDMELEDEDVDVEVGLRTLFSTMDSCSLVYAETVGDTD
ncbi:hypothetical protein ANN_25786 [Periplaneta americana]|uniref:Uncharacterized protein n=1 Tax=Periplaneta americana TaxID=6978 RepID=A0ABQ8S4D5_PERAM|nr:hypothetical protein ANN_25786 [Periplaneta americana]